MKNASAECIGERKKNETIIHDEWTTEPIKEWRLASIEEMNGEIKLNVFVQSASIIIYSFISFCAFRRSLLYICFRFVAAAHSFQIQLFYPHDRNAFTRTTYNTVSRVVSVTIFAVVTVFLHNDMQHNDIKQIIFIFITRAQTRFVSTDIQWTHSGVGIFDHTTNSVAACDRLPLN